MSRTIGQHEIIFHYPQHINWCYVCNVPILSDETTCPLCGYNIEPMAVGKGEIRPVFQPEKKWYYELLKADGMDPDTFLPEGLLFYYRGTIIIGGQKVFRVTYDEQKRVWRTKLFKKFRDKPYDLIGSKEHIFIEANNHVLMEAELESLNFIQKTFNNYKNMPTGVSFSGGKDSAVVLYLTRKLCPDIDVIYLNTTIEYPETGKYVNKIKHDWNLNLYEVKPNRNFFDLCNELGPPSQYMKWCCKVIKFAPLSRFIEEKYGTPILMVSGVRKNESHSRSTYSRVQKNDKIPNQLLIFPILDWNSLLVWLYVSWKKIPINEAYLEGRSRIGCWPCPERRPKEFAKLRRTHPQLWDKLKKTLYLYGKSHGIFDITDWIESCKWRLRASKYDKKYIKSKNLCSMNNEFLYTIPENNDMNKIIEFFKVFGDIKKEKNLIRINSHIMEFSIIRNKVRVTYYEPVAKKYFERQLEKAINCIGCGACLSVCPNRAISIINHKIHISDDCNHCLKCLNNNGLRKSCISLNYKTQQILIR